ncbi:unnamed protein product, partial [Polarella glacialis]
VRLSATKSGLAAQKQPRAVKLPESLPLRSSQAIGVDEAGRGPLAGPVVAAAVAVLPGAVLPPGVVDSKKLTEARRELVYESLLAVDGLFYEVSIVDHRRIDEVNILEATFEAMSTAVQRLMPRAPHCRKILIDGNSIPRQLRDLKSSHPDWDLEAVVKGDQKYFAIAAASIIAKVQRDRIMVQLHEVYPEYGFASHKGYGTKVHLEALKQYGATPVHRRSFSPVAGLSENFRFGVPVLVSEKSDPVTASANSARGAADFSKMQVEYRIPISRVDEHPGQGPLSASGAKQVIIIPGIFGSSKRRVASVEWWAHLRPAGVASGHQMHFDLDEASLGSLPDGAAPSSPLVSCVLYLTGPTVDISGKADDAMASTLVTDQALGTSKGARKGWLCSPRLNRLLLFDGSLLHGVIPGLPKGQTPKRPRPSQTSSEVPVQERVTLMFGLWGDSPGPTCSTGLPDGVLGPNMPVPRATASAGPRWPKLLSLVGDSRLKPTRKQTAERGVAAAGLSGPITPVWVQIAASGKPATASGGELAQAQSKRRRKAEEQDDSVQFVGRWFLDHEPSALQAKVISEAKQMTFGGEAAEGSLEVEEVSLEELQALRKAAEGATKRKR